MNSPMALLAAALGEAVVLASSLAEQSASVSV
jgi:hypothetical protein